MAAAPVVDEVELLRELAPLEGARLVELGCGRADFSRKLVEKAPVESLVAFEVDRRQHERNLASARDPRLEFGFGGAEAIPLPDASVDGVMMMKSLHHVPTTLLDVALGEIRRVLKPGGWAYISEPVYAGDFNEIVRQFNEEKAVRAAARAALDRAAEAGVLESVTQREFVVPRNFRDYEDFLDKVVRVTHSDFHFPPEIEAEVKRLFERSMTPTGARFLQPMRVDFMRRPTIVTPQ
jgi:SAM-dependent methyltransferase